MEAAKREGGVTWYTSVNLPTAQKLTEAFEKKYGIKVEVFRTGGEQVLQRFNTELAAGRVVADVLNASDPVAFDELGKKGQLVPFRPEHFDKVPPSARSEDGYWMSQRLNLSIITFRGDLENEAEMPKTWKDLADPKYKGKLVHPDPAFSSVTLQIVAMLARDYGWEYYEALKRNDMLIVQGSQQVGQILTVGERTIAAQASNGEMFSLMSKGISIKWVIAEDGVFSVPAPTGVVANSPHPNAGKLLAEFTLSDEGQKILAADGHYPARIDIPAPEGNPALSGLKLNPIDYDYTEKNAQQTKDRFAEIFSN